MQSVNTLDGGTRGLHIDQCFPCYMMSWVGYLTENMPKRSPYSYFLSLLTILQVLHVYKYYMFTC